PEKEKLSCVETPWNAVHKNNISTIEAYIEEISDWQPVAEVKQTASIDAAPNADFIVRAVNSYEDNRSLIRSMIAALELCLESKGLSWEAEQEAEIIIARALQRI